MFNTWQKSNAELQMFCIVSEASKEFQSKASNRISSAFITSPTNLDSWLGSFDLWKASKLDELPPTCWVIKNLRLNIMESLIQLVSQIIIRVEALNSNSIPEKYLLVADLCSKVINTGTIISAERQPSKTFQTSTVSITSDSSSSPTWPFCTDVCEKLKVTLQDSSWCNWHPTLQRSCLSKCPKMILKSLRSRKKLLGQLHRTLERCKCNQLHS